MKNNAIMTCPESIEGNTFSLTRFFGRFRRLAALPTAAALLLACGGVANATVLAGWEMTGLPGGASNFGPSPYAAATTGANLTVGGLTRGGGVATSGTGAQNAWGGSAWTDTSEAAAIGSSRFATFTITANAGYKVSFTDIPAYNIRRSNTGPTTGIWQYQVGAGAFTDIGSPITWGSVTSASGNPQGAIDLSGIAALQNVPAGTTVTFRIVTWSGGSAGTWYVNSPTGSGQDLQVEGTVDADAPPAAPVANDASTITSSAFIANWSASAGASGYQLDVATDNGFGSFVPGYNNLDVLNVTSMAVSGLSANTTYYYRVRAYNAAGTSGNSNTKSVTTIGTVSATKMTVTLPGQTAANTGTPTPQTSGTPFNVTLKAVLNDGTTVDTTYTGPRNINFSGPTGNPVYPASVTFASGVGTASITLNKAETTTLSATDTLLTGIQSSSFAVNPATYFWVATSDTASWTNATSWTPNRIAPGVDDTLLFNQGGASTATDVPSEIIVSLQVSNNTAITLQGGGATTLIFAGGADALSVGAGPALNVAGSSVVTLNLPTGSTASISGAMDFAGAAHKLLPTDASGVTFQNGASFTADTGFSGNAFGITTLNSVIFAAGSTYIQKAGANPFGAPQPSSVVVFQTGSLYRVTGNLAPSFSGRTYADLEINAANFNQSSTGGATLTMDNLTVTAGTLNLNLTGGINIKGNVTVAGGQTLTFSPGNAGTVNFNGTSPQTISGGGTFNISTNSVNVTSGSTLLVQSPIGTIAATTITVDGTLGGSSSITGAGSVIVSASGTLSPGASIGTLTFDTVPALGGVTYMQLDRNANPNADEIALTGGTFNYSGSLTVTNLGATLANGDSFTLFAAPGFNGWFDPVILPTLSAGLNFDTNKLASLGVLDVYSFVTNGTAPLPVVKNTAMNLPVSTVFSKTTGGRGGLALASAAGASHGVLTTNATTITYTPNANYVGSDSFICSVLDTNNAVANVNVLVTVSNSGGGGNTSTLAIQPSGASFTIRITGTPGVNYQLQRSAAVSPTNWSAVGGVFNMPAGGTTNMNVTPSGNTGFYRTILP